MAIAICPRCGFKVYHGELRQDPNNKNWYCGGCVDQFDPWRLPARGTDKISIQHPRPDVSLAEDGGWLESENGSPLFTEEGDNLDV